MAQPLMPKATAVWLVDNTALTFDQIADFCGLHNLEVQAIADGEVAPGMQGLDPTANGQLNRDEIVRCEADVSARMEMAKPSVPMPKVRQKGARYTPISKRQDRPDAISWLLRSYPELSDAQISRLIGTTKPTINAIRDKTHRNSANIKPQSPVYLGLCVAADLEKMIAIARARAGTTHTPTQPLPPIAASEPQEEPAILPSQPQEPAVTEPTAEDVFGTAKAPKPEEEQVSSSDVFGPAAAPSEDSATEAAPAEDSSTESEPAKETAPVEDSSTEDEPVKEAAPVEDKPTEDEPVKETAPVEDKPTEDEPVKEAAAVEDSSTEDKPAEGSSAGVPE
tara:strand:- start:1206 stop:2216 length:1011 start_codon:yes stop_codon:yes gene_type:complete